MKTKTVAETYTLKTEMVLPNDTNNLGNLMGGKLLHWMDIAAAISAQRASNRTVVTVAVDFVEFRSPVPQGSIVILEARVTRTWTSSLEVRIDVQCEDLSTGNRTETNTAYYTFVAVDQSGRPIPVTPIIPETELEKQWHEEAASRREVRLLLSGQMKVEDASHLQALLGTKKA